MRGAQLDDCEILSSPPFLQFYHLVSGILLPFTLGTGKILEKMGSTEVIFSSFQGRGVNLGYSESPFLESFVPTLTTMWAVPLQCQTISLWSFLLAPRRQKATLFFFSSGHRCLEPNLSLCSHQSRLLDLSFFLFFLSLDYFLITDWQECGQSLQLVLNLVFLWAEQLLLVTRWKGSIVVSCLLLQEDYPRSQLWWFLFLPIHLVILGFSQCLQLLLKPSPPSFLHQKVKQLANQMQMKPSWPLSKKINIKKLPHQITMVPSVSCLYPSYINSR